MTRPGRTRGAIQADILVKEAELQALYDEMTDTFPPAPTQRGEVRKFVKLHMPDGSELDIPEEDTVAITEAKTRGGQEGPPS